MTSIHPESYPLARRIMELHKITPNMFGQPQMQLMVEFMDRRKLRKELEIDNYTLEDILDAFVQPLRDQEMSFQHQF